MTKRSLAVARGIAHVIRFRQRRCIVGIPHIGEAFIKEQREDVLLVVPGIHQPAQHGGRAPQVGFQFWLGHGVQLMPATRLLHHPRAGSSSASRTRASAVLKSRTASSKGGMSAPMGGST